MALIIMLPIAGMLALLCKKRIEETFALAIFIIMSLLYVSGLFVSFVPGIVLSCIFSFGSFVYVGYKLLRDRDQSKSQIFTVGLVVYVVLALYFLIVSYGRNFNLVSDEPHYWAAALKYYYSVSGLSDTPYSYSAIFYHGPVTLIWEYFSTKLWFRFSSGFALWGADLLLVSLAMPIFSCYKSAKDVKKIIITSLLVILIPTYDATVGYTTVMADTALFFVFAYSIIAIEKYLTEKSNFYYFQFAYAGCILVLTKRVGIILILLLSFIYAVMLKYSLKNKVRQYTSIVIYVLACLASLATWEVFLQLVFDRGSGLSAYFRILKSLFIEKPVVMIGLILTGIVVVILLYIVGKGKINRIAYILATLFFIVCIVTIYVSDTEVTIKRNALKYVVDSLIGYEDILLVGNVIKVIPGIFMIVVYGLWYLLAHKLEEQQSKFYMNLIISILVSYLIYQMISLTGYVLRQRGITEYFVIDARYFYPYYIAMMLVTLYFVVKHADYLTFDKKTELALLVFSLLFFDCGSVVTNLFDKKEEHHFYGIDDYAFDYTDKIFFLDWNSDTRDLTYEFLYQIFPANCNYHGRMYWSEYEGDTIENIEEQLTSNGYNYIYIETVDAEFKKAFADLFENADDIANNHLYSVVQTDHGVKFELVN